MADEDIQDEGINQEDVQDDIELEEGQQDSKVEKRIKALSNKVKLTAKERDDRDKAAKKAEAERDSAKKEVEFYSSFSDSIEKYPAAKEYKDKIKEKVLAGYPVEDAVVTVLAKEGKLSGVAQATQTVAGGSATNLPNTGGDKKLDDMTREEKRAEVIKSIERGEISLN
jgi:hypothetical protein